MGFLGTIKGRWRQMALLLGAILSVLLAFLSGLITAGIGEAGFEALVFGLIVVVATVLLLSLVVLGLTVAVWRQTTTIRSLQH